MRSVLAVAAFGLLLTLPVGADEPTEKGKQMLDAAAKVLKDKNVDTAKGVFSKSGLWTYDAKVGDGKAPSGPSDTVEVHYTGWLTSGKKFDSSHDRGQTIKFPLNRVIKGWTEGVGSMKVGGKRILVIPPELAYGDRDVGNGLIPAGSILIFEVELVGIGE